MQAPSGSYGEDDVRQMQFDGDVNVSTVLIPKTGEHVSRERVLDLSDQLRRWLSEKEAALRERQ